MPLKFVFVYPLSLKERDRERDTKRDTFFLSVEGGKRDRKKVSEGKGKTERDVKRETSQLFCT
jgi:hypothetical protein